MRLTGLIIGGLIVAAGLAFILTPLRMYLIIGWLVGSLLIVGMLVEVVKHLKCKSFGKMQIIEAVVMLGLGIALIATDLQQTLTQVVIVYIVAGGLAISGLIKLIVAYISVKKGKKALGIIVNGALSLLIGIAGFVFKNAVATIIGVLVGFHIANFGLTIFIAAWHMKKTIVATINGEYTETTVNPELPKEN